MNPIKTIKIIKFFNSISEALEASGMDISYNPALAKQRAKELDNDQRGKVGRVMLIEGNRIAYTYKCDILLLNEFSPFHSILDDSSLHVALVQSFEIKIDKTAIPKTPQWRKLIAKMGWMVTGL